MNHTSITARATFAPELAVHSGQSLRTGQSRRATMHNTLRTAQRVCGCTLFALLGGCSAQLLLPRGAVGDREETLTIVALALLVAVPVIGLTLYFAWRYRTSNTIVKYAPDRPHLTRIERVAWTIPWVSVTVLAVMIGSTRQGFDTSRPIAPDAAPLRVEVVALKEKWLFIYPDYGIASVNQLQLPVGTPVEFTLTAESLTHSFSIPRLGKQVYAMPGMQTSLHLIANHTGIFNGMPAAFSDSRCADTAFDTASITRAEFDAWIAQARDAASALDEETYAALALDAHGYPATLYRAALPGLFDKIANQDMHAAPMAPICTPAPLASAGQAHQTVTAATATAISSAASTASVYSSNDPAD